MKRFASTLFLTVAVLTSFSHCVALDVFLMNITIYRDHEPNRLFFKDHPEVYLSCNDGRPNIELKHVDDEHRIYTFSLGELLATTVEEGACVDCRLKESDGAILKDDHFGDFPLCFHQFTETGDHVAFVPGQFRMGFQCPDCLVVQNVEPIPEPGIEEEEEVLVPVPEPGDDFETELEYEIVEAPPSIESIEEESDEDPIGQYYYFTTTTGRTFSAENGDEPVGLQGEEGDSRGVQSGSTDGLSTWTVLSLCFVFLIVGVGIGVVVFRKYSAKIANDKAMVTAFEMSKLGFMKKGKI